MFSLQRFLCRNELIFDLIEELAASSASSVKTLSEALANPDQFKSVDEILQKRRRSRELNDEIAHRLCMTFLTPLEREDIEMLAIALTRISKTSEKFMSQYFVFKTRLKSEYFEGQAELMAQAAEVLVELVKQIRIKSNITHAEELNSQLRFCESKSDMLMSHLVENMYMSKNESLSTIFAAKSLQEVLEKLTDRLRDAGNIIFSIVLKYA